jgi:broad specificity phosphatase PhoE
LSRILSASTRSTASMLMSTHDDRVTPPSLCDETNNGTTTAVTVSNSSDQQQQQQDSKNDNTSQSSSRIIKENNNRKILIGVRHGISTANEYMRQPGRCWGDATFYDDVQYTDAPLSKIAGRQQVCQLAVSFEETVESLLFESQQQQEREQERSSHESVGVVRTPNTVAVELVVVSPLTRCLETWLYGVRPALSALSLSSAAPVPCVVLPLAAERVYTSSDTGGRISLQQLRSDFSQPELDWSYMPAATPATTTTGTTIATNAEADESPPWWYTGNNIYPPPNTAITTTDEINKSQSQQQQQQPEQQHDSLEWRPHGQGQFYACPGEPQDVFEQRMRQLATWLRQRPERCIVLVTHWGVLQYLGDSDVENCGVVRINGFGNE